MTCRLTRKVMMKTSGSMRSCKSGLLLLNRNPARNGKATWIIISVLTGAVMKNKSLEVDMNLTEIIIAVIGLILSILSTKPYSPLPKST